MAHIVGVPKREPCQKCGLPVFLAERLSLGQQLFHRTCLRCARCNSQLSPGSFYETEVDGEFCCETCPDEEKELTLRDRLKLDGLSRDDTEGRKSFREKLAIFQNDGKGLLQKSLSDEEKSRSLKRLNALLTSPQSSHDVPSQKTNTALMNFLSTEVIDQQQSTTSLSSNVSSETNISSESSIATTTDETENNDLLNEIQQTDTTLPPSAIHVFSSSLDHKDNVSKNSFQQSLVLNDPSSTTVFTSIDNISAPSDNNTIDQSETKLSDKSNSNNTSEYQSEPINELLIINNVTKENENNNKQTIKTCKIIGETKKHSDENMITTVDGEKLETNLESSLTSNTIITQCDRTFKVKISEQIETNSDDEILFSDHNSVDIESIKEMIDELIQEAVELINNKPRFSQLNQFENCIDIKRQYNEGLFYDRDDTINNSSDRIEILGEKNNSINNLSVQVPNDDNYLNVANDTKSDCTIPTELIIETIVSSQTEPEKEINEKNINEIQIQNKSTVVSPVKNNKDNDPNKNCLEVIIRENIVKSNEDERIQPTVTPRRRSVKPNDLSNDLLPIALPPTPLKRKTIQNSEISKLSSNNIINSHISASSKLYPEFLNPFASDDDNKDVDNALNQLQSTVNKMKEKSDLNPFDSSDDEIELLKPDVINRSVTKKLNELSESNRNEIGYDRKYPVPIPRKSIITSLNTTPEPTPRMQRMTLAGYGVKHFHGSETCLSPVYRPMDTTMKNMQIYGSTSSLASTSSTNAYTKRKKGRAPLPPSMFSNSTSHSTPMKQENQSLECSPTSSVISTPVTRKKRIAPRPPSSTPKKELFPSEITESMLFTISNQALDSSLDSNCSVISTEEIQPNLFEHHHIRDSDQFLTDIETTENIIPQRKLIPLEASLVDDLETQPKSKITEHESVVYRRTIVPMSPDTMFTTNGDLPIYQSDTAEETRQWQKMKENKESQNKNRQSQISLPSPQSEIDPLYSNKSSYGKWKRRKGPAPGLPVPPRKVLQMVPLQEIRHELEVIEVQQQGLEKQGVMLEKMIRDRCETNDHHNQISISEKESLPAPPNSKEVEDLILQLFELVNEKNELFRRQAELMYLRRQHRLEQEQADIEYEIRVLMAQPELNKTDSDKAREESLIARLVEVVQLRNEVIDCLEMDRLREAEEDQSIKRRLELHNAQRDEELNKQTPTKLSKKEKKKQKESKKLAKQKKMDADKDADESESREEIPKDKKKKRKFLF